MYSKIVQSEKCRVQSGQTLLEVVVVVSVSVIVITGLVFATIASLRNAQFSKNQAQATKLAQEGLERVRVGRDRNQCVNNIYGDTVSWNGNSSNAACPGVGKIWDYLLNGPGLCNDATNFNPPKKCYFVVNSEGSLTFKASQDNFPESLAEGIPPPSPIFRRVITLADGSPYDKQKIVTAIVRWTDFSGFHESKLITILRNI